MKDFEIQPTCILLPSNDASLFSGIKPKKPQKFPFWSLVNGSLAGSGITLITTPYNLLVGDSVLNLEETSCEQIFLFGSCGGLPGMNVGDRVLVKEAVNLESFTLMNKQNFHDLEFVPAPGNLSSNLFQFRKEAGLKEVIGATVSSLALEKKWIPILKNSGVSVMDMEASAVFSAASAIGRMAAAVLYVSDIVGSHTPGTFLSVSEHDKLKNSRKILAQFLLDYISHGHS